MKIFTNEKNILNIIKYGAILLIIILSFAITQISIQQTSKKLTKDIEQLEKDYINHNKEMVQNLVTRIHSFIEIEKNKALVDLKKQLKNEVYKAHAIASAIYTKNKQKTNYSKKDTIEEIKTSLGAIRFNENRGYIFIDAKNGIKLLHPIKEVEGKNLLEYKDAKGYQFVKKIVQTIKNKTESYDEYYWYKESDKTRALKKIGFYKTFEPYELAIGTAEYIKDFENNLKKDILAKINALKFKKPTHLFMYDLEGWCLTNPKKELIGTNRYNTKRKDGSYGLRDMLKFVEKNKEGFSRYNSSVVLDNTLKSNDKISFVKLFEEWGWMIGSGFHLEVLNRNIETKILDLEKLNDETIEKIIMFSIMVTIIMIGFSFYISNAVAKIFRQYKLDLKNEMQEKFQKEKMLIQQSKMATMGEMLGSIAHQWKQPLSVISMSNGLLRYVKEDKDFLEDKDHIESLDNIDNSVANLSQTIDDFRNFFNPNKTRVLFNINQALEDTLKLISSQLTNNNIEIVKDTTDIELYGSQNELQQTLINILKNAKEELVKKDSNEKRYIFITTEKDDDFIFIKIKDNANGIKESNIENIFDAYFTTKESEGGTGIGLYMSKQIVEISLKGKITASNVEYNYKDIPYKGAQFIISIPLDLRGKKNRRKN